MADEFADTTRVWTGKINVALMPSEGSGARKIQVSGFGGAMK